MASHSMATGLMFLSIMVLWWSYIPWLVHGVLVILLGFSVWGYWLGSQLSGGPKEPLLLSRAAFKTIVGFLILITGVIADSYFTLPSPSYYVIDYAAAWFLVTGFTRLHLLQRDPPARRVEEMLPSKPYGDAKFGNPQDMNR